MQITSASRLGEGTIEDMSLHAFHLRT